MNFIIPIVSIEALGDWSFTKFVEGRRTHVFQKLLGYMSYIGVLEMFQKTIELKGLSWANSAWDGWSNLATNLVAILFLGERPTQKELFGMFLISAGLFFLGTEAIAQYNQ